MTLTYKFKGGQPTLVFFKKKMRYPLRPPPPTLTKPLLSVKCDSVSVWYNKYNITILI